MFPFFLLEEPFLFPPVYGRKAITQALRTATIVHGVMSMTGHEVLDLSRNTTRLSARCVETYALWPGRGGEGGLYRPPDWERGVTRGKFWPDNMANNPDALLLFPPNLFKGDVTISSLTRDQVSTSPVGMVSIVGTLERPPPTPHLTPPRTPAPPLRSWGGGVLKFLPSRIVGRLWKRAHVLFGSMLLLQHMQLRARDQKGPKPAHLMCKTKRYHVQICRPSLRG